VKSFHQHSSFVGGSIFSVSRRHYGGNQQSKDITITNTSLFMGKKLQNRQAELQKKMMLAKQQKEQHQSNSADNDNDDEEVDSSSKVDSRLTDEEIKEQNDRKRFEALLNSSSASIRMSVDADGNSVSDNYLTIEQEDETIDAYRKFSIQIFKKNFVNLNLNLNYYSQFDIIFISCYLCFIMSLSLSLSLYIYIYIYIYIIVIRAWC
jgi:hypothetical protein